MKKLLWLLLFAPLAYGQVSSPGVIYQANAPSGACATAPPIRVVDSTGTIYTCDSGTWAAQGSGGGGTVTAVTGVSPIQSSGGATPAISCPTCSTAGLPSGTQGQPLINTSGSSTYATSSIFFDASQFAGADPSIQVNACLAAAIAVHGTCDARALVSPANVSYPHAPQYQITSEQITVGDTTNDPVTLLLPNFFYWAGGMTDGTSCTLKQYPNTTIIAPGTMNAGTAVMGAGPSSNLGYVYCATGITGDSYIYDFGFSIINQTSGTLYVGHATANNIGAYIAGPFYDETTWDHMNWSDSLDTYVWSSFGLCCATKFTSNSWNGQYAAIPIQLLATASGSEVSPIFENSSIVHNPAGSPLVTMTDSLNGQSAISFKHIYSEAYANTSGTGLFYFSGVGSVNMDDIVIKAENSATSTPAIVTTSGTNTFLQVSSLYMGSASGSFTYPATAIVDGYSGRTIFSTTATAGGFSMLPIWSSSQNYFGVGGLLSYSQALTGNTGNLAVGNTSTLPAAATGPENTGISPDALTALTSGGTDVAVGTSALATITTGSSDTAVGVGAGTNSTTMVTNSDSSFFGDAASCSANALTNDLVLGYNAECTASNQAVIGNANVTDAYFGSTGGTIEAKSVLHGAAFESAGTKFTTSGCSVSSTTGGASAGKMTLGANTCSVVITMNGATGYTATNGWSCKANDETTAAATATLYFTATNTTTATLSVPATAGTTDVIDFSCTAF